MSAPQPIPRWRRRVALLLLTTLLVLGTLAAIPWITYRFTHSITKDAFVDSHLVNVAPQVAGTVVEVFVQEQSRVRKGDLLARIDPSLYQREVDLASAKLGVAEAALEKSQADLTLLQAEVPRRVSIADRKLAIARADEAKADLARSMVRLDVEKSLDAAHQGIAAAKAAAVMAEEDYRRYTGLVKDGSATERRLQEATKVHHTARADVRIAVAKLGQAEAARKQIGIADQQWKAAGHAVAEAEAALELARLGHQQIAVREKEVAQSRQAVAEARRAVDLARTNLGYTRIVAPFDGVIAKKWRHLGDYARPGEALFSTYNPELLYVTANLEETLLEGVAPGNDVELRVEAFRSPFRGRVVWVGSATGANFALIPRDVSAGEFTYVVQRVPTRIAIERDERWGRLKPGLSVRVAIAHGEGDAEWAANELRREAQIEGIPGKQP